MGYPDLELKHRTSENWYLWVPKDTQITFIGRNGHDYQLKDALDILKVGKLYTVLAREVHGGFTEIYLKEFGPDMPFNSVMFEFPNGLSRAAQKVVGQ